MTRINEAPPQWPLSAPDPASSKPSTSSAPAGAGSTSGAAPGAGGAAPRPSSSSGNRIRINMTRVFSDKSMSVNVHDLPVPAEGAHFSSVRESGKLAGMVTSTLDKMAAGETHAQLRKVLDAKLETGHWMSDSHFHPTNYAQQGMVPREMLKMMDEAGIHRSVMSPIPTDVMPCGDHGDHNHIPAESYYVPAQFANIKPHDLTDEVEQTIKGSAHLMLNQQVDADTALSLNIAQLSQAERDRLDPMVTGLHLGSPLSPQALLFKLATHPGMFTGVGEVTIHKELVQSQYEGARQANRTDNVQAFKNLVATAGVIGMPVVLHCDVDSTANQRANGYDNPEHLDNLKKLFASPETRDTTIIWAHCGGVGRFVQKPVDHADNLRSILANPDMQHINIDISWSRVARQIVLKTDDEGKEVPDHESVEAWAQLINDHPDRFLFGSDALNPQEKATWQETGVLYKPLLDKLTPEARTAVMTGNYEKVLVGARPKVRAFEEHVLTPNFIEQRLRGSGEGRLNPGPHIDPAALRAARDAAFAEANVDLNGNELSGDKPEIVAAENAPAPVAAGKKPMPAQLKAHLEKNHAAHEAAPAKKETPEQVKAHLEKIKQQRDEKLAALVAPSEKPGSGRLRKLFGAR